MMELKHGMIVRFVNGTWALVAGIKDGQVTYHVSYGSRGQFQHFQHQDAKEDFLPMVEAYRERANGKLIELKKAA